VIILEDRRSMEPRQPAEGQGRGATCPGLSSSSPAIGSKTADSTPNNSAFRGYLASSRPASRLIAFNEYVNDDLREVTVVQVHPDAASLEFNIGIVSDRAREA
jgi:hypothetical protein